MQLPIETSTSTFTSGLLDLPTKNMHTFLLFWTCRMNGRQKNARRVLVGKLLSKAAKIISITGI
jgi:hypothetical protein